MMDILEKFVNKLDYSYLRMDGRTSVRARQPMIAQFNEVHFDYLTYRLQVLLIILSFYLMYMYVSITAMLREAWLGFKTISALLR